MGTLKPQSNGPLYSNMVIGTLTIDGWAATFGIVRRGLGGLRHQHTTLTTLLAIMKYTSRPTERCSKGYRYR